MKEGAHIAGYSLTRSIENLRWLLEDAKYEQLSAGYRNVNDFLRDTADAFKLLDIKPEERKQIAELIKELQPQASQRAIADLVGVSNETIAKDLGARTSVNKLTVQDKTSEENIPIGVNKLTPPALPPDDYDVVEARRKRQNVEASLVEKKKAIERYTEEVRCSPVLDKSYHVIYADPPWRYSDSTNTLDAVTDHHYATMSIDDLETYLEDYQIKTARDAVLFIWVTNPFVKKALGVVDAWGFEYKTNIVWIKTDLKKPGVGYYVRGRHELLFICTRGSFTPLDKNISPPIGSVLESPLREHSRKPEEVYEIMV
jgi:N6-adenosine-specific RNA methylase IME4